MLAPVTLVSFARAGDVPPPPPDPVLAQRGDIIVRDDPAALPVSWCAADQRFEVLAEGDALAVTFVVAPGAHDVRLVARGYYQPLR